MAERFFREIERSLDENSCVTSRTLAAITHSNVQTVQRLFVVILFSFFVSTLI
jgi:hypothetical protein